MKKVINPGKQVQLVKEWVSHTDGGNEVCFQHNKNITSVIGMQTRKLDATTVKERLRSYHQAILDGTIGDLMTDKGTYAWFKVADRPSRPSDGLGPYKLMPKVAGIFEISVEDQTRLCTYLGIDSESWDRAGSVVVDCFSWWTTEKYTRPPPLLQQLSPSLLFPFPLSPPCTPAPRASWLILIEFHCMLVNVHFVALVLAFSGRAIPRMIDLNGIASFSSGIN